LKKKLITLAKLIFSLSIGVVLIALVFKNLSKPVDFFADDLPSSEANYYLKSWSVEDVFGLEDTLCIVYDDNQIEYPILSKFEGKISERLIKPEEVFTRTSSIALVKIDLWLVIRSAFKRVNYWWIFVSILMATASNISRAIRWRDMFNALGYFPKMYNVISAVLTTYLGNLAFPRLGEVMRCSFMATYEKIPLQKSLGTMITERLIDLLCLGMVFLLTITFEYKVFLQFYNENMRSTNQDGDNGMVLKIVIGSVLVIGMVVFWVLLKKNKIPYAEKVKHLVKDMLEGVKSVSKLKNKWSYFFHTILMWAMYWGMNVTSLLALPDTAEVAFSAALPCLLFGGIAMTLVQGGIGIYPLFISQVLVLYSVAKPIGYAYGWVAWTVQTSLVVVFGLLSLFLLNYLNRKRLKID
jgi:glycosyltransferase 2 family protein